MYSLLIPRPSFNILLLFQAYPEYLITYLIQKPEGSAEGELATVPWIQLLTTLIQQVSVFHTVAVIHGFDIDTIRTLPAVSLRSLDGMMLIFDLDEMVFPPVIIPPHIQCVPPVQNLAPNLFPARESTQCTSLFWIACNKLLSVIDYHHS